MSPEEKPGGPPPPPPQAGRCRGARPQQQQQQQPRRGGLLSEIRTAIRSEPFHLRYRLSPGRELGRCVRDGGGRRKWGGTAKPS